MKISFPIIKAYNSDNYSLVILDFNSVYHYWNEDGTYDGYSHDPCVNGETGIVLN